MSAVGTIVDARGRVTGRVLTPDGWVGGRVVTEGGTVAAVEAVESHRGGPLLVPGFVDLQVNGAFGHDLTTEPEAMWEVGAGLVRFGVTAFLPTIVSSPPGATSRALAALAAGPPPGYAGARPLGLHLEGPMLAPGRHGAHDPRLLVAPSLHVIDGWSRGAGVRMVTLAPELAGAIDVVRALVARGVVVSIGHSDATYEQARDAIDAGAAAGTHLFNAMSGFDHRAPGVAGALLASDVVATVIADGVHVHPGALSAAWRGKGRGSLALITDAVAPMGAGSGGTSRLGETPLAVDDDAVRAPSGALAGSLLSLDLAVRNLVRLAGARPEDALSAASATPAALLGEPAIGSLAPGSAADMTVLDDELEVVATIVGGRVAYDRHGP